MRSEYSVTLSEELQHFHHPVGPIDRSPAHEGDRHPTAVRFVMRCADRRSSRVHPTPQTRGRSLSIQRSQQAHRRLRPPLTFPTPRSRDTARWYRHPATPSREPRLRGRRVVHLMPTPPAFADRDLDHAVVQLTAPECLPRSPPPTPEARCSIAKDCDDSRRLSLRSPRSPRAQHAATLPGPLRAELSNLHHSTPAASASRV